MKQDLWLVNRSLLCLFVAVLGIYGLLQQEPPVWIAPKISIAPDIEKKKDLVAKPNTWQKIYQDDIFGTYIPTAVTTVKQSLVTPIPEPRPPVIPPIPEPKKQEFIPPLNINLRGIIAGGDENKNVAMIADESGKEGMYHFGEKVKDAQIIKIAHNRIIFLRANGQQEIFYLRKDDLPTTLEPAEKWKYIVKKIDDQNYEVDPKALLREVETLGQFIEQAAVIGTIFSQGKPLGIRIGNPTQSPLATSLGIVENDIIPSINNITIAEPQNRLKAYDSVTQAALGSIIKVGIKRADKDVFLSYKLAKIEPPKKSHFG